MRVVLGGLMSGISTQGLPSTLSIKKLQSIQIQFYRTPGQAFEQIMKIVQQLIMRQVIHLIIEVQPDAPDSTRISLDGFGLQAPELEVFAVERIILVELHIN